MFGHRSDGRVIKTLPAIFKLMPTVMEERSDSQVMFKQDVLIKYMDEYIDEKLKEGIHLSYMSVIYAAIVRIIAERPELNRFVMNGRIYARNDIVISLTIKKSLSDGGEETVVKIPFTGAENIFEVRDKLNQAVMENKSESANNDTDDLVKVLNALPDGLVRKAVKFLKFLDRHNAMPKSVIQASPFHTSAFLTNVGSIGIDSIYHHIYNFGTTSMFFAMGKKKKNYVYADEVLKEEKCISIAFVGDERICDGYYYASSFKQLSKYLKNPRLLEEHPVRKEDIK